MSWKVLGKSWNFCEWQNWNRECSLARPVYVLNWHSYVIFYFLGVWLPFSIAVILWYHYALPGADSDTDHNLLVVKIHISLKKLWKSTLGKRWDKENLKNKIVEFAKNVDSKLAQVARWLIGRASDLRSSSRGFEARPRRCCVTTLGKLFTPYCLCHQAV